MKPVPFPMANGSLGAPPQAQELGLKVESAPVFVGTSPQGVGVVIQCWEMTDEEIEKIKKTKRVWVTFLGHRVPPVALDSEDPFMPQIPPSEISIPDLSTIRRVSREDLTK